MTTTNVCDSCFGIFVSFFFLLFLLCVSLFLLLHLRVVCVLLAFVWIGCSFGLCWRQCRAYELFGLEYVLLSCAVIRITCCVDALPSLHPPSPSLSKTTRNNEIAELHERTHVILCVLLGCRGYENIVHHKRRVHSRHRDKLTRHMQRAICRRLKTK